MTEQAKHTPGPWHVGRGKGRGWYIDTEREHLSIHYPVADFVYVDADARLIAAAPDLLEAAKRAVVRLIGAYDEFATGEGLWSVEDRYTIDALRSAIAKAEGADLHSAAE